MTAREQAAGRAVPLTTSSDSTGTVAGPMDLRGGLLTAAMYLVFVTTWIGAKYGLQSFPPLTLGFVRTGLAALLLLAFCVWRGYSFPRQPRQLMLAAGLGVFTAGVPASLGFWAVQHTQSSLANVILSTQPFLVILLAHQFLPSEPLSRRKVAGLVIGFAGVGVISFDKSGGDGAGSLIGQLALVATALSVAVSAVLGKNMSRSWQVIPFTTVQTIGGGFFVLCCVLLFELGAPVFLTPAGVGAAVYLALGPTILGYCLWVFLIDRYSASGVSSFAFAQPVFGIGLGWLLFAENFTFLTIIGMALVTWSIVTVNRRG